MSNPMLRSDKFASTSGPPSAWPGGRQAGSPGAPVPPAPDNVAGAPWPPPASPTAEPTLRRGGVASATAVLLAIICVTGVVGWNAVTTTPDSLGSSVQIPGWVLIAMLVGLGLALVSFFKPRLAPVTAPLYAVAEGLVLGAISAAYEAEFTGIVLQAVGLTIGVFLIMLVLYATGRIRVTPRFRMVIVAATGAIFLVYMVSFVLSLLGSGVPYIHSNGLVGIGFSLVVVVVAALNLTLDFDFIDRAEQGGAPKYMEWFAALGLVVTLVWLYLEMLRLISKLRR